MPSISSGSYSGGSGACSVDRDRLRAVQVGDDAPRQRQRVDVVARQMVGDAGQPRVHVAAAEVFGA